jgi:hypothetical protein
MEPEIMVEFRLGDLPFFEYLNTQFYMLHFFNKYLYLSDNDMDQIFDCIRDYARRANKLYPEASFFLGLSSTDSQDCSEKKLKTGKAGRPKKIIEGKKVNKHIHIAGTGKKICPAMSFVKERLDKKFELESDGPVCKIESWKGINAVAYIYKQADKIRTVGDFDFDKLKDPFCLLF